MNTKTVRVESRPGVKWELPEVLCFRSAYHQTYTSRAHMRFYEVTEFRCPKKGEWFISGAPAGVYKTNNDLSTEYLIAKPGARAKCETRWVIDDSK